jgi:hypothetical protein
MLHDQRHLPGLADAAAVRLKDISGRLQAMVEVDRLDLNIGPVRRRIGSLAPTLEPFQQDSGIKPPREGHEQPWGDLRGRLRRIL